jgi:hypothetical protein
MLRGLFLWSFDFAVSVNLLTISYKCVNKFSCRNSIKLTANVLMAFFLPLCLVHPFIGPFQQLFDT